MFALLSQITNKQQTPNLMPPFSNSKRTTTDKSKEDFMKLIAQEVRMYNKNGEDFQRVCVYLLLFTVKFFIVIVCVFSHFVFRQWNNFLLNKSNNV